MQSNLIFNFEKDVNTDNWYVLNDNVMGGVSTSRIYVSNDGYGVFEGSVSLENNGGFAMTQYNCAITNVKKYTKIILKVKGDGKTYQFRVKDNRNNYYSYIQNFETTGKNQTIELQLSDFEPYFRGRKLNMANYNENTIEQVAILIGNKKAETFKLLIDSIKIK